MARARWLKPEFFTDARVCAVSDQAALVFAALWGHADDAGVTIGDPRDIYGRSFLKRPSWTVALVATCLDELATVGLVVPFAHRGERYALIRDFARKQGIERTQKKWRLLGVEQHETVVDGVLRRVIKESGEQTPFTPKQLPEQLPEPSQEPKPKPFGGDGRNGQPPALTDDATRQYEELDASLSAAAMTIAVGYVRAAQFPGAVVAAIRALGPGGLEERPDVSWEVVSRALEDMAAAGVSPFTPNALRGFIRGAQREPTGPAAGQFADQLAAVGKRVTA